MIWRAVGLGLLLSKIAPLDRFSPFTRDRLCKPDYDGIAMDGKAVCMALGCFSWGLHKRGSVQEKGSGWT